MPKAKKNRHHLAVLVGTRIAQFRKARGWKQVDLGKRCGMGQKRISDVERGVTTPQVDTLDRVAKALAVEPYELLLSESAKVMARGDVDPRKIEGFLKRCDPKARKFLWVVMVDFAGYRAD